MRECNPYEQLMFLDEQLQKNDSIREQDYDVLVSEIPYRGILLNSGYAVVARSAFTRGPMEIQAVTFPRFFILEPGHARPPARGEAR
jgi:hypothetical protein